MASSGIKLAWVIILCLVTVVVDMSMSSTLLLFSLRETGRTFTSDFYKFSFSKSTSDIWIQSLLRVCLLIGALTGITLNAKDGKIRASKVLKVLKYFTICLELHVVVKLLYWAEDSKAYMKTVIWLLFSNAFVMNILMYWVWRAYCDVSSRTRPTNLNVNCADSNEFQTDGLVRSSLDESDDNSSDSDSVSSEDDAKYKKSKLGTWTVVLKLLSLAKPDWLYLLPGFLCLILASIGQVFLPLYTGRVIDGITIKRDYSEFIHSMSIMSFISLGVGLFSGLRGGILCFVSARFTLRLQNNLYAKVLDQEIAFYDSKKTGEIISRLTSDTTKVVDQLTLNINVFLRNVIKLIGVLVFMFKLSWKLTVLTLVGLPLIFEIYGTFGSYYEKLSEDVQTSLASANESAAEAFASIRTVRSFGAEDIEKRRYHFKLGKTFLLKKKESLAYGGFICINEVLELALTLLVLFYGGHLVLNGDMSGGHLVSFILYDLELGDSLEGIGDIYTGLMEAVGAARKVFHYLERKPKMPQNGCLAPSILKGEIEFSNVTFAYPTRPELPALKNLSFTAKPGEVVALVGPSGGGKSTIVSMLEHFYAPQDGGIFIDGIPISHFEHKFLHTRISLVAQEPVLFARTISENISYGIREEVPHQRIIDAATHANISQFIQDLPNGYETETGEKGVQLSGGQKQRVAIARALIRDPTILILDEATSALDSESEFLVQDAINRNLNGRTVLIIAHRLSTIERADKILVIEDGYLVEEGTHADLFAKNGVYTSLAKRQLLSAVKNTI